MTRRQATKRYMAMILIELLMDQKATKLTVATFLKTANLSRTTFYNHFPTGMCGLFRWTLEQQIIQKVDESIVSGDWESGCHEVVQFITRYRMFCLNLYYLADYPERRRFFEQVMKQIIHKALRHYKTQYTPQQLNHLEDFYGGAIIRQLDCWFENNLQTEPEVIDERLCFNLKQLEKIVKSG
ncbi:TetR/AcrR family transcriptional regulator [Latilactobacillus curvatus]|uniref:TetR/AcrR family transcriptional regulator n=1 Tax=Latilactobacillus curvatus TaxID=28038 RepID=UPI000978AA75|nr:TetR/AcrR family transcriptional regulator [Latilactobacillus curvatus]